MAVRAPKQWTLTKNETITSFEAWNINNSWFGEAVQNWNCKHKCGVVQ